MMDYEKTLLDLVQDMVLDPSSVSVKKMDTLDEKEILLYVYANHDELARLIGKKGIMATSLRQMMSIPARNENKRVTIKFESF